MKKIIVSAFFMMLPISCQSLYAQTNQAKLDSLAKALGNSFLKDHNGVGLTVGIYRDGKSDIYNFGSTTADKINIPTGNTVYEIGSITKTFISYVLANAVLENKVQLNDDIRKYLKDSYPNLEYKGNPIRLADLANTTSLLPDWLPELPDEIKNKSGDEALTLKIKKYKSLDRKDFFKALHDVKPDTIPGSRSAHSNAAALLLAYILEDVYKQPMDNLINRYITTPAGMKHTAFMTENTGPGTATGYTSNNNKAVYETSIPYFKYAGGIGSTAHDMINYISMFLDKDNKIASLALKKTVDMDASTGKVIALKADNITAPDFYSAALGWFKYQPDAATAQIWADGGTNGFNSYLVLYPLSDSGIIILANKSDEKVFRALPGIAYQLAALINQK